MAFFDFIWVGSEKGDAALFEDADVDRGGLTR